MNILLGFQVARHPTTFHLYGISHHYTAHAHVPRTPLSPDTFPFSLAAALFFSLLVSGAHWFRCFARTFHLHTPYQILVCGSAFWHTGRPERSPSCEQDGGGRACG